MDEYVEKLLKAIGKGKDVDPKAFRVSNEYEKIEVIPTGIDDLDHAVIGNGGIPRGRMTEIWGGYGGGKTTLAGQIVANMHSEDVKTYFEGTVLFIDAEGKFDPTWWEKWGVNTNKVIVSNNFDYGEEAYLHMQRFIDKVDIIILDSVASLTCKEELERGLEDNQRMAPNARMHGTWIPKIVNGGLDKKSGEQTGIALRNSKTAVIMINQVRANTGVVYGPQEKRYGGKALDHHVALMLQVGNKGADKERDQYKGITKQKIGIRCTKNNFAPPLRETELMLDVVNCRFESIGSMVALNRAIEKNLIEKRGAWLYSEHFPEEKLHGAEKFYEFLETEEGEKLTELIKKEGGNDGTDKNTD